MDGYLLNAEVKREYYYIILHLYNLIYETRIVHIGGLRLQFLVDSLAVSANVGDHKVELQSDIWFRLYSVTEAIFMDCSLPVTETFSRSSSDKARPSS